MYFEPNLAGPASKPQVRHRKSERASALKARIISRRTWLEFRIGHAQYLAFTLQIVNFALIAHALFLEKVGVNLELWQFALILAATYMPLAVLLGKQHIKTQYKVENSALFEQNTAWAKVLYLHTKMIEGTATEQERTELKDYLFKISQK